MSTAYANFPRRALARRLQDQVGADTLAECLGVTPDALPDLLADAVPWPSAALAGLVRLAQRVDRASPAQPAPPPAEPSSQSQPSLQSQPSPQPQPSSQSQPSLQSQPSPQPQPSSQSQPSLQSQPSPQPQPPPNAAPPLISKAARQQDLYRLVALARLWGLSDQLPFDEFCRLQELLAQLELALILDFGVSAPLPGERWDLRRQWREAETRLSRLREIRQARAAWQRRGWRRWRPAGKLPDPAALLRQLMAEADRLTVAADDCPGPAGGLVLNRAGLEPILQARWRQPSAGTPATAP